MEIDKIRSLGKTFESLSNKSDKDLTRRKKVDTLNNLAHKTRDVNPEKSGEYARQALTLAKKIHYRKGCAQSNLHIGISHSTLGHFDQAVKYYKKAQLIFKDIKDRKGLGHIYYCMGMHYTQQSNFHLSLRYYHTALKIYEKYGFKENIAIVYCGIGDNYTNTQDFDKALAYFCKAERISKKIRSKDILAAAQENIANTYGYLAKYDQALNYGNKALALYRELGHMASIAHCMSNIGETFLRKGTTDEALKYLRKSLKISEKLKTSEVMAHTCSVIGDAYMKAKHYDEAFNFLCKALELARETGKKIFEMNCYESLHNLFKVQKDYEKALMYHQKYATLKDEIFNAEKSKQIANMRMRHEVEQKRKKTEIYRIKTIILSREIKQRKRAERELREYQDHLEDLITERTAALKKENAQRKHAEKGLLDYQQQLRLLAREMSLIEERQRRRFANFLHDDISQALALATFKLRSIQEMNPGKNIQKELGDVNAIIDKTAERTRTLATEISPPILYELGLEPALEWLVRRFGKQYKISAKFEDDGLSKPLSDDARVFLFQSVRELLSNVSKHAKAHSVKVSAIRSSNNIRITVEDDGIGFNPKQNNMKVIKNEGFGLFNVRERLRHLNGQLKLRSKEENGTSVVLIAPLTRIKRARR